MPDTQALRYVSFAVAPRILDDRLAHELGSRAMLLPRQHFQQTVFRLRQIQRGFGQCRHNVNCMLRHIFGQASSMHRSLSSLLLLTPLSVNAGQDRFLGAERFDDYVDRGARILVVGAHPDDESLAGPLLAYACVQKGNDCHIAIFTSGGGGTCGLFLFLQSCEPDLATVRIREMERAAERYGAGLDLGNFSNQRPKLSHDKTKREAIRAGWEWEGDPIVKFEPDLLITLDPEHGFTGNAEHQLASLLVNEVLDPRKGRAPSPKRPVVFHVINRYTVVKPLLGNDPTLPTEQWSFGHRCGKQSCARIAMDIASEHRSQLAVSALALFVLFADRFDVLHLRKLPVRALGDPP